MEEETLTEWKSKSNSMTSSMVGRAMNTLLSLKPKKLEEAITRLGDASKTRSSIVSLEESLWLLNKYIRDAAEREELLDDVLVPIIEHSLKCKNSKNRIQAMALLNWLFQDEVLFEALAKDLADLVKRKEDRYIALGWCILVRDLLEYDKSRNQYLKDVTGVRKRHNALLKILCQSISHLSLIICNGSILQDGFELPTRLSVAAADCILVVTGALTQKPLGSEIPSERSRASKSNASNKPVSILGEGQMEPKNVSSDASNHTEMGLLLWEHLDELVILVQKLHSWSKKSRPLHAKGAELVLKWLQGIKSNHGCFHDEAGSKALKTGILLLSSCWKHYGKLLQLEDSEILVHCEGLIDQYLAGMQIYTDAGIKECMENKDTGVETRKFFLNCLALLLGRLGSKKLANIISEYGSRILAAVLLQFRCADEDVTEEAVSIFRFTIFKMTANPREMEALFPSLLQLLDERDGAARSVVILVAEYCSISANSWCLEEVLKRFTSGSIAQRRNAADILQKLIHISSDSTEGPSISFWKDIAKHLLDRLADEDSVVRRQAMKLLPLIDPSLVLPALVRLVSASSGRIGSAVNTAFLGVLRHHNQNFEVISLLLDCLSSSSQNKICQDYTEPSGDTVEGGSNLDADPVLKLIPEWSKTVEDWTPLVGPLIEKMLLEPSNATVIKFLSHISEHLADAADVILRRLLLNVKGQREMDKSSFAGVEANPHMSSDLVPTLFDRLCPLLIIKLLPLRVFDDLHSTIMYGQFLGQGIAQGFEYFDISYYDCVAAFLFNRAFCQFEFDNVRKLAAELCGRIHPQVLFPIAFSQLEHAVEIKDILKMKACLFSICTSLAIRGKDSVSHPIIPKIAGVLRTILLWPSMDGDEVSKAQHGCIDCLALIICAEVQLPKSLQDSALEKSSTTGCTASGSPVLSIVIDHLTNENRDTGIPLEVAGIPASRMVIPFRLCLANVLITVCQKISDSGKIFFVQKTLPSLMKSVEVLADAEIRAAGIQVLFSCVYHLKLAILPYASDLLKLSLKSLGEGSEKEKIASAKLMASLMASEDAVVQNISEGLLDARSVLSNICMSGESLELRQLCEKLRVCLTSR
ncbi:hypothetical protein Ancab_030997 [Ancistrocladus abbreviatus]